jgi:hypothetical protein
VRAASLFCQRFVLERMPSVPMPVAGLKLSTLGIQSHHPELCRTPLNELSSDRMRVAGLKRTCV